MKPLTAATTILDRTLTFLYALAGVLLVFVLLSVCAEVVMRYLFNRPIVWVIEISEVILLYITFLATAWLLKKGGHVKVDILLNRLNPRTQALLSIISCTVGVIVSLCFVWYGAQVTWDHFQRGYFEPTLLEIPSAALVAIIPVGGFLLLTQFLRDAHRYLRSWRVSPDREQGL